GGERVAFPKPPRELAERYYNVTSWAEHPTGGHFPPSPSLNCWPAAYATHFARCDTGPETHHHSLRFHEQAELSPPSCRAGSPSASSWTGRRGAPLSHCDKHLYDALARLGLRGKQDTFLVSALARGHWGRPPTAAEGVDDGIGGICSADCRTSSGTCWRRRCHSAASAAIEATCSGACRGGRASGDARPTDERGGFHHAGTNPCNSPSTGATRWLIAPNGFAGPFPRPSRVEGSSHAPTGTSTDVMKLRPPTQLTATENRTVMRDSGDGRNQTLRKPCARDAGAAFAGVIPGRWQTEQHDPAATRTLALRAAWNRLRGSHPRLAIRLQAGAQPRFRARQTSSQG
ncbi:MAG: hypothetical protein JWL77_7102, partial [Chthonomonadaceae bacterium]|nr:hypothetical protein [Chthonomonadaceae bacterium]